MERITGGELVPGARLPSEHELMNRFEVSRVTVRQAFGCLQELGLIESKQGKGHFVKRFKAVQNLERLQSFGEMMLPFGMETHSDVIELLEVPADSDVAQSLQLTTGDPVTRIARCRVAGNVTVSLDISYFPVSLGRKIQSLDLTNKDIFLLLENTVGVALGYSDLQIDVVPARQEYFSYLNLNQGDSVIRIRRTTHDINGLPIDHEYIYSPLETMQFSIRLARW